MGIRSTIDWVKGAAILYHVGRGSMLDAANYMAARAVDHAPVDTGYLSFNIAVVPGVGESSIVAQVVSMAPYSQWVEFGHQTIAGNFVPPNPYMRRAMADTAREFGEIARKRSIARPERYDPASYLTTTLSF